MNCIVCFIIILTTSLSLTAKEPVSKLTEKQVLEIKSNVNTEGLDRINQLINNDKNLVANSSHLFMFENRWSAYAIKVVRFRNETDNTCYFWMKNNSCEKLSISHIKNIRGSYVV